MGKVLKAKVMDAEKRKSIQVMANLPLCFSFVVGS
jgi:hypothetical protein